MRKEKYNPPYTVSEEAVNLIAEISSAIERYNITMAGADGLRLRKINRVKTIRGSTAIEGNTLSEEQITAVLEGKRVVAPKKEIDEVLGAAAAYEQIENIDAAPIENIVWENQSGYYLAIRRASLIGNAEPFIDFMLERILETIKAKGDSLKKNVGVNVGVKLSARERDLIELIRLDGSLTAARIAETYSISTRQAERLLTSLKKKGFIVREGSDKAGLWVVKER